MMNTQVQKVRRFVLVGCGSMSRTWFLLIRKFYAERLELVGLVDLFPESAQKYAVEFGDLAKGPVPVGTSLVEMIDKVKPDVVFDCTIPDAHHGNILTALEKGCDVLTEKPLSASVAQAREVVQSAKEKGRLVAVIQNRRYMGGGIAVRQALASGVIGKVHSVYADFFLAPRFGGFRDAMKHVLLLDMAIHTFDQGRHMTGFDPVRALCHEFNPSGSWYAHGASAIATFEMTGGAVFSYRGSWCAQGLSTSWQADWRIIGERGTLRWDGDNEINIETIEGEAIGEGHFIQSVTRQTLPVEPLEEEASNHGGVISEFLNALDTGVEPQTVAHDNILSLAMVEAAIASAQCGTWVPITV